MEPFICSIGSASTRGRCILEIYEGKRRVMHVLQALNILMVGDVVGDAGCAALRAHLPVLKKWKSVDVTVVNGENSAAGNGVTAASARHLFDSGADVITTGNHVWKRPEAQPLLDKNETILRPANFPDSAPGHGICILDKGYAQVAVFNWQGVVYLENLACPFETADKLIEQAKAAGIKIILCDFHAEATAEKRAVASYLDGRVSVFAGTHTHVQTADEQILPGGTAFITDLGMCGPINSVLGVKTEQAVRRMKEKLPVRFEHADGPCHIDAALFTVDRATGRATGVERIQVT